MKKTEIKTNAMRILERNKIPYEAIQYECEEFIDGLHTAQITGAPVEQSFKTLLQWESPVHNSPCSFPEPPES